MVFAQAMLSAEQPSARPTVARVIDHGTGVLCLTRMVATRSEAKLQKWPPQIRFWYKCLIVFFRTPFQQNLSPLPRTRGKPALVMHSAMACPSICKTPVGTNRAEPCPYLHGGQTGFSPVSACSPVSRMGLSRQETDISEPSWSCLCRPSQNTPIIYAASFSIGQVYRRESCSRACPMPFRAWL